RDDAGPVSHHEFLVSLFDERGHVGYERVAVGRGLRDHGRGQVTHRGSSSNEKPALHSICPTMVFVVAGVVSAADYPDRPIRFITISRPSRSSPRSARSGSSRPPHITSFTCRLFNTIVARQRTAAPIG